MANSPSDPPSGFPLPGGPPPGYYGMPPQRPANNNAGCLKAFGITCGVLFLLGALALIFGTVFVKNQIANPGGGIFGTAVRIGHASMDGALLQRAIVAYHAKNGKYPKNLMQLVTDGETDGRLFHNALDPNPSPAHISWRYFPPSEGAPGSTPILAEPYTITVGSQTQQGQIVINLNGTSGAGAATPVGNDAPSNSS